MCVRLCLCLCVCVCLKVEHEHGIISQFCIALTYERLCLLVVQGIDAIECLTQILLSALASNEIG